MNALAGRHWVAGVWREPSGTTFGLRQRVTPFEPLGQWPRGDAALIEEALEGAAAASGAWLELSATERVRRLRDAIWGLRRDTQRAEHLEHYLGLTASELEPETSGLDRVAESLEGATPDDGGETRVLLVRWTDLVCELARRTVPELAAGHSVVLVSDDRWPVGAELLGQALEAAGIPPGLVAVVHGVSNELRTTLAVGQAGLSTSVPYRVAVGAAPSAHTVAVQLEDDLAQSAKAVVQRAFGRAEALSGQRPGRVGRVVCHARVFSAFSEALLEALGDSKDVNDPIPMIDGASLGALRGLWELGLDEGATMIFGGEPFSSPGAGGRNNDRRAWPAVFTNVEPGMSLCRQREPAPLLCLLRADSDASSQEIARALG